MQNYILIMMSSFSDYLNKREWYGGEPGAESMASDQADQFGSSVRTTAMQQYGDDDVNDICFVEVAIEYFSHCLYSF